MNKKIFLALLLLTVSLLVACTDESEEEPLDTPTPVSEDTEEAVETPQSPESEVEPVSVGFAVFDFEQGLYNDLIAAFEEENPDIEIKLVSVEETLELESLGAEWPDDARRRLVAAADVSSVFYTQEALRDGLLLDLGPFLEADPNFDPADFQPGILESYQSEGGTWAIPTEANYQLIFFNKDAFDEAGLDYPQPGWSWDDFRATAEALTIGEGEEKTQWGFAEVTSDPALFVESRVGPLYDMTADPPTVDFEDPAVTEAFSWYVDLYLKDEVAPYFPSPDEDEGFSIPEGYLVIEQGQAAMWPDVSGAFTFRKQQMNIGAAPMPSDSSEAKSNRLYPGGLSVSVGTANPEAAWRWVDFLSRQSSDPLAMFGGRANLPARTSVAEASGFWDEVDEELAPSLRYAIDHAYASSAPPGAGNILRDAFEAIVEGEKTLDEALADAQIAAEEAVAEGLVEAEGEPEEIIVEGSSSEDLASEDAVTVEFVAVTGPLEMQTFRDLSRHFLEMNPDVVVEIKQPNFFDGTPTMKDIAEASDCFQWFPGDFNDLETQDALLSLDPFLDADADIDESEFYPAVMDAFIAQGQTWGLPGQVNITLIEYDKDLFDAANLDYPANDWTIDDFLGAAVALTQGDEETKQYGYVPDLFEPADMLNMMDRLGARLIDDSTDPPTLALDDPATIEAVRWYTGLTTEHGVKPVLMTSLTGAPVTAVQERQTLLDEGRAAMWTNSAYNVILGEDEESETNTGAVPLPVGVGDAPGSGYQSATGYFISAGTEAREACWEWIKYLTEQPDVGIGLPARQSVAESSAYRQQVGPDLADAYLTSMKNSTQPPFTQQISDENSWLNYPIFWLYGAYDQILNEGVVVDEALLNAQQLVDEYQACVIASEAFNDEEAQKACMLQTDDTLPAFIFGTE